MTNNSVQGFKSVPLGFSINASSPHSIFIKAHSTRVYDESKPPGKTLFVLNIPPYATEDGLKNAFSKAGKIRSVFLQKNVPNCGFQTGYLVFEKQDSVMKAMKLSILEPLSTEDKPILTGISKWIREYNASILDPAALRIEIQERMKKKDAKEEEEKLQSKNPVDEDGWTLVTKKSRTPGVSRKETVTNKIIAKNKLKSRKKELKNFYTFQIKEQKMNNIVALRKSFQESKEKINAMKQLRVFKPF